MSKIITISIASSVEKIHFSIEHRYQKVNTEIDSLVYYITQNGDKVCDGTPQLINTIQIDDYYKSDYTIDVSRSDVSRSDVSRSDVSRSDLHIVLPFDYKTSIIALVDLIEQF